jgi:hypothetical protein
MVGIQYSVLTRLSNTYWSRPETFHHDPVRLSIAKKLLAAKTRSVVKIQGVLFANTPTRESKRTTTSACLGIGKVLTQFRIKGDSQTRTKVRNTSGMCCFWLSRRVITNFCTTDHQMQAEE